MSRSNCSRPARLSGDALKLLRYWSASAGDVMLLHMTIEDDRSVVERVAVRWQDVSGLEQEAMLARLGAMPEYLDPTEDAEYQLRRDATLLMRKIEGSLRL